MGDTEDKGVKTYCPRCKVFEHRDGDYCSSCGAELTIPPLLPKCPKCDHEVRIADSYCKNCGTKLEINLPAPPELPAKPELPGDPALPGNSAGLKKYVTEVEVIGPE